MHVIVCSTYEYRWWWCSRARGITFGAAHPSLRRATTCQFCLVPRVSVHDRYYCIAIRTHSYGWLNWGDAERTKMPKLRNGSPRDSNPGSVDSEFGFLPLSHRAQGWLPYYIIITWPHRNARIQWAYQLVSRACHFAICQHWLSVIYNCSRLMQGAWV